LEENPHFHAKNKLLSILSVRIEFHMIEPGICFRNVIHHSISMGSSRIVSVVIDNVWKKTPIFMLKNK
jgi:hypothetical protein